MIVYKLNEYDIIPGAQRVLKELLGDVNYFRGEGKCVSKHVLLKKSGAASTSVIRNYISRIRNLLVDQGIGEVVTVVNPTEDDIEYQFKFLPHQKGKVIALQNVLGMTTPNTNFVLGDKVDVFVEGAKPTCGTIIELDEDYIDVELDKISVVREYVSRKESA